ncbi:MAG TPA: hypothetical protein IGS17_09810 [Oscillatoriales cyanobacterium M59_W2019_021]|nr:hypothetical protein [Oscillatoriales cyanobacterium M4454_W2019_049]HIK51202.1 hypothetical protein [Oscillatoriales cyanobacterium M59_W2019_021]
MNEINWNIRWSQLSPEIKSRIQTYCQKWRAIFSRLIDPDRAIATVSQLYQRAGYSPPKVLFVDSPLAVEIAPNALRYLSSACLTPVGQEIFELSGQLDRQLFEQLQSQFEDEYEPIYFICAASTSQLKIRKRSCYLEQLGHCSGIIWR